MDPALRASYGRTPKGTPLRTPAGTPQRTPQRTPAATPLRGTAATPARAAQVRFVGLLMRGCAVPALPVRHMLRGRVICRLSHPKISVRTMVVLLTFRCRGVPCGTRPRRTPLGVWGRARRLRRTGRLPSARLRFHRGKRCVNQHCHALRPCANLRGDPVAAGNKASLSTTSLRTDCRADVVRAIRRLIAVDVFGPHLQVAGASAADGGHKTATVTPAANSLTDNLLDL